MKSLLVLSSLLLVVSGEKPESFIVDTDIGPYPDDVGAFAILHNYADRNLINIRAMMANNRYEGIVPVIEAMNRYFNRSTIQIGVTKDSSAFSWAGNDSWTDYILQNYPHPMYQSNAEAEDAVTLYRRMLATSQDHEITILSIGHFTNLANLLQTNGDQYSPLSGRELIRTKVKRMVAMAGQFPNGAEWNIVHDVNASRITIRDWPTPILFVGFEVGDRILCGGNLLNNSQLAKSPVRKAFELYYHMNNNMLDGCYDEVAALVAVAGLTSIYHRVDGIIEIMSNGTDVWHHSQRETSMAYVRQMVADQKVLDVINPLLAR